MSAKRKVRARSKRAQALRMYTHAKILYSAERGAAHSLWLNIGVQSFQINGHMTKAEARWMRRMLAIALANLVGHYAERIHRPPTKEKK